MLCYAEFDMDDMTISCTIEHIILKGKNNILKK